MTYERCVLRLLPAASDGDAHYVEITDQYYVGRDQHGVTVTDAKNGVGAHTFYPMNRVLHVQVWPEP